MSGALGVSVDGVPMAEAEARAFWERFSAWMDEHRGDLAGFAAKEGFASVHPGVDGGRPVLRASRSASQKPYAPVREGGAPRSGGSDGRPRAAPTARGESRNRPKSRRRRG